MRTNYYHQDALKQNVQVAVLPLQSLLGCQSKGLRGLGGPILT